MIEKFRQECEMWKKVLTIFVLISQAMSLSYPQETQLLLQDKTKSALTKSVTDIIRNLYVKRTSSMDFFYSFDRHEEELDARFFINEILWNLDGNIPVNLASIASLRVKKKRRYAYNVFFVSSHASFRKILVKMTHLNFNHQGLYLIVITRVDYGIYKTMEHIFSDLWSEFIVNVNIVWMPLENDNEILMFTYFPYNEFYCGSIAPIIINQFVDNNWTLAVRGYFPDKMRNLHGCVLSIATFNNPPFAMIVKEHESGQLKMDGIDGMLLHVISERMNFTIQLDIVDELWGNVVVKGGNFEATGELDTVSLLCHA